MAICLERGKGLRLPTDEQLGLECPYCGVYSHVTPQSTPDVDRLLKDKPKKVGLVFQCDACHAPIFLRFAVREFRPDAVELFRNFVELDRPKEKFAFSYLPKETEVLFREALACYSTNSFNAFASMCRRSAISAFKAMGENGKLRAFDEVMTAKRIARLDDDSFAPIKKILFETVDEVDLPVLNRAQAGMLLEVLKDMFYQCFVREAKLSRAIKVRRFFVEDGAKSRRNSA
jgi:hypothetical protein